MNVIADAGAVGSGVIVAEDLDGFAASEGHIEDERNQVGLWMMRFAACNAWRTFGRTGHVE